MKEYNHYETYEWLGSFSLSDQSIQFPGKLSYSPESGVELEFLSITETPSLSELLNIKRTRYIHGALASNEICTLFFGGSSSYDYNLHSGQAIAFKGKFRLETILFGKHSSPEDKYDGVLLDLTNLQNICHPKGNKTLAKHSTKPIQQKKHKDLIASIKNNIKYSISVGDTEFENLFHCNNEKIIKEIRNFFKKLNKKYPKDIIFTRSDIEWFFEVQSNIGLTVEEAIKKQIFSAENLFSLLAYSPARRKKVFMINKSIHTIGKFEKLPLLTNLVDIDRIKIDFLRKKERKSHNLIFTTDNSNFTELFIKWKRIEGEFQSFSAITSNRFKKSPRHVLYAEFILNLVQLEAISQSHKSGSKDKYDLALKKYASEDIKNLMRSYFSITNSKKLGEALGELRGEIAHLNKSPNHLKNLSLSALNGISQLIGIVIASYIYEKLGISNNNITNFQNAQVRLLPPPVKSQ